MIKFITGNKAKIIEAKAILAPIKIESMNIDLTEIQEADTHKIIKHKLQEALKHHNGPLLVDDSALFFECFNYKLPGPLIKWFNIHVGMQGLANLTKKMGKVKARAVTVIGYAKNSKDIKFFQGILEGKIVNPRGSYGFGYDRIFQPAGKTQTLSQIKSANDFSYSPRALALNKLKKYLLKNQ